jgi:hypothetical protein
MNVPTVSSDSTNIASAVLGQLAYHVRFAAALAADGRADESVPHAVLSWALLRSASGDAWRESVAAFDLPDEIGGVHRVAALDECKPAEELALQLCAHFTSAGQHALAQLYQGAYQVLASDA